MAPRSVAAMLPLASDDVGLLNMAVLFWLHIWTMGGSGDTPSVFINVNCFDIQPQAESLLLCGQKSLI